MLDLVGELLDQVGLVLLVGPVVAVVLVAAVVRGRLTAARGLALAALVVWALLVINITLAPLQWLFDGLRVNGSWQLLQPVPFATIARYWDADGLVRQVGGNVLLFTPLGLIGPALWQRLRSPAACLFVGVGLSVAVEGTQWLTNVFQLGIPRTVDIDDVILNTLGVAVGWGLWRVADTALGRTRGGRRLVAAIDSGRAVTTTPDPAQPPARQ